MKELLKLLTLTGVALLANASDPGPITMGPTSTNRVTNVLSVLSVQPVPQDRCPECGGPNHHDQQTVLLSVHDEIYQSLVTPLGMTNRLLVGLGPTNRYLGTNVVFSRRRSQPGWETPPMPLPVSTNR